MSSQCSKDYTKKVVTLPNVLSLFRIILIPLIIWAYCVLQSPTVTALLVVLSGLTDVVDGFIARHFNMISNVGKALDPIADKLTQIAMLFCLWTRVPLILLPLIVCLSMKLLGFGAEWIRFAAIVSSMPSATTVTMLTELHDITPEYSAQVVGTNSLFSILTMPCVIWIAQRIIEL